MFPDLAIQWEASDKTLRSGWTFVSKDSPLPPAIRAARGLTSLRLAMCSPAWPLRLTSNTSSWLKVITNSARIWITWLLPSLTQPTSSKRKQRRKRSKMSNSRNMILMHHLRKSATQSLELRVLPWSPRPRRRRKRYLRRLFSSSALYYSRKRPRICGINLIRKWRRYCTRRSQPLIKWTLTIEVSA